MTLFVVILRLSERRHCRKTVWRLSHRTYGTCYLWLSETRTLANSLSYIFRLGSSSVPTC